MHRNTHLYCTVFCCSAVPAEGGIRWEKKIVLASEAVKSECLEPFFSNRVMFMES